MKRFLLFIPLLLVSVVAHTQITFERTYGGTGIDVGNSVICTSDDGYLIVGQTKNLDSADYDVYLIKTDVMGDTIWTRSYGMSNKDEYGQSVTEANDGGGVIVGYKWDFPGGKNIYIIKVNNNGDTLWTRTYGNEDNEDAFFIQSTNDSCFVITGYKNSYVGGDSDVYLMKIDANGDTIWMKTYGGSSPDYGLCLSLTTDGGYAITGSVDGFPYPTGKACIIRTNGIGDTLWTRKYVVGEAYSIASTSDSGFIITGRGLSNQLFLIKTTATGDTVWSKEYGWDYSSTGYSVVQTFDGGYLVSGVIQDSGAPSSADVYLIRTDAWGDTIWTKRCGGSSADQSYSMIKTPDGGFALTGYTGSYGAGMADVYFIKMDSVGNFSYVRDYPSCHLKVKIYPNPATTRITLQLPPQFEQATTIEVFDRIGQLVLMMDYSAEVDVSALPSGLYFVVVSNEDGERVRGRFVRE